MPIWQRIGFALAGVASVSGLGYMLYTAVQKVGSGQGLSTYRTTWLVEFNWVGFLVFIAVLLVALLVGFAFRFREHLRWRELERKYGHGRDAA